MKLTTATEHITQAFSVFFCLEANAERVSSSKLLLRFSHATPRFKLIRIKPLNCKEHQIVFPNYTIGHYSQTQNPCF